MGLKNMKKKVEKRLKITSKKGLKLLSKTPKITQTQQETLSLFSDDFLTIKQVAQRRGCTIQAVYKTLKILKKKGLINTVLKKVEKVEPTYNKRDIRLHAQEFNVKILLQDNKYQKLLEKSNILFIDGNTIRLYRNSVEIYSGKSFYGKTPQESEKKSLEYWHKFLTRLEHELKITILKSRARNIRIVNHHYARGDSEICYNAIKNKKRVWIYAEEDGKLCFITDNSFGFKEDETVHPRTAKPDRKAIDKQVNDWRLNDPPTNSELNTNLTKATNILLSNQHLIADLPQVIGSLKTQIKSHLKLIQEYRKENKVWRKETTKKIKTQLEKQKEQSRLKDFF